MDIGTDRVGPPATGKPVTLPPPAGAVKIPYPSMKAGASSAGAPSSRLNPLCSRWGEEQTVGRWQELQDMTGGGSWGKNERERGRKKCMREGGRLGGVENRSQPYKG